MGVFENFYKTRYLSAVRSLLRGVAKPLFYRQLACIFCNLTVFFMLFFFVQSLDGISDIRDESDRSGMRIVIEVKYINMALLLIPVFSFLVGTYKKREKIRKGKKETVEY